MSTILDTERDTYASLWSAVPAYGDHAPGEHYLPTFLSMVRPNIGSTVLDAGCGSGKGALALLTAGFEHVRMCDVTDAGLVQDARILGFDNLRDGRQAPMPFFEACLWHDLSPVTRAFGHPGRTKADYVYCCDVLEHIPPQFTMLAIDQMLRVADRGLFLAVSLVPDQFGAWAGTSLHHSVFPFTWWRDSLQELGTILESRDLLDNAVFLVVRA